MNSSKFFDSEWIRLSQRLQQSLDRYEREARERAAAEGEAMAMVASTAASEAGQRRSAGLPEQTEDDGVTMVEGAEVNGASESLQSSEQTEETDSGTDEEEGRASVRAADESQPLERTKASKDGEGREEIHAFSSTVESEVSGCDETKELRPRGQAIVSNRNASALSIETDVIVTTIKLAAAGSTEEWCKAANTMGAAEVDEEERDRDAPTAIPNKRRAIRHGVETLAESPEKRSTQSRVTNWRYRKKTNDANQCRPSSSVERDQPAMRAVAARKLPSNVPPWPPPSLEELSVTVTPSPSTITRGDPPVLGLLCVGSIWEKLVRGETSGEPPGSGIVIFPWRHRRGIITNSVETEKAILCFFPAINRVSSSNKEVHIDWEREMAKYGRITWSEKEPIINAVDTSNEAPYSPSTVTIKIHTTRSSGVHSMMGDLHSDTDRREGEPVTNHRLDLLEFRVESEEPRLSAAPAVRMAEAPVTSQADNEANPKIKMEEVIKEVRSMEGMKQEGKPASQRSIACILWVRQGIFSSQLHILELALQTGALVMGCLDKLIFRFGNDALPWYGVDEREGKSGRWVEGHIMEKRTPRTGNKLLLHVLPSMDRLWRLEELSINCHGIIKLPLFIISLGEDEEEDSGHMHGNERWCCSIKVQGVWILEAVVNGIQSGERRVCGELWLVFISICVADMIASSIKDDRRHVVRKESGEIGTVGGGSMKVEAVNVEFAVSFNEIGKRGKKWKKRKKWRNHCAGGTRKAEKWIQLVNLEGKVGFKGEGMIETYSPRVSIITTISILEIIVRIDNYLVDKFRGIIRFSALFLYKCTLLFG
ncbi:unnamed protein product [Linum trigynum]|uniref:Uncharacterized protein n=1 Tax=Linum trigynum TaxID=586398 RepID=A0AAV2CEJ3_9ROSI